MSFPTSALLWVWVLSKYYIRFNQILFLLQIGFIIQFILSQLRQLIYPPQTILLFSYTRIQWAIFEQKMYTLVPKLTQKPAQFKIQLPLTIKPPETNQTQQPQNISRKDYRNGTYLGNIVNNVRSGLGLLVMDSGQLLFGNWENGQAHGECVYLSNEMRDFGKIGHRGVLEGFHVCKMMGSMNQPDGESESARKNMSMTLYGNFKESKLFGRFVAVIKQNIYLCNTNNSQKLSIIDKIKNNKRQSLSEILTSTFPYIQTFQLHSYLSLLIQKSANLPPTKYYPTIQSYPAAKLKYPAQSEDNKIFYGYSTHRAYNKDKCRQFGFILYNEELLSIGEHRYGQPHGLARVFEYEGGIHDGIFQNGRAHGIGVRYQTDSKRFTFGQFRKQMAYSSNLRKNNNVKPDVAEVYEEGTNWPQKIIKQYRKDSHVRTIYFDNDFGEISINFPYEQFRKVYKQLVSQQIKREASQTIPLNNYFTVAPYQNRRRYTEASPSGRVWNKKPNISPSTLDKFKQKSFTKQNHVPIFGNSSAGKEETDLSQYRSSNNYSLSDNKNVSPFVFEEKEKTNIKQDSLKNRQNRANTDYNMIGQFKK